MNRPTAEVMALSGKVMQAARDYMRKNISEFGDVKEPTTFVAPFILAAKMFLRNTELTKDEQRKMVLELWDKLDYAATTKPTRFFC